MAFTQGSRSRISFIAETTLGVTPATPVFQAINFQSFDLAPTLTMSENPVIRSDRNSSLPTPGNQGSTGQIVGPLHYQGYDSLIAGALGGTWTANVVKNGVLKPTFSMERAHLDTAQYGIGRGMYVNGMTLNFAAGEPVGATFNMIGKSFAWSSAEPQVSFATSTTDPVSANNLMRSASGVVTEGGQTIALMTSANITLNNGGEQLYVYGSNSAAELSQSTVQVTGTISLYWENKTMIQKFLSGAQSSLSIKASNGTNEYTITLPAIRYTGGNAPVSTAGALTLEMPFVAGYDATADCTISVTRTA